MYLTMGWFLTVFSICTGNFLFGGFCLLVTNFWASKAFIVHETQDKWKPGMAEKAHFFDLT